MTYQRLDPGHPKAVVLATKLGVTDAGRLAAQAREAGMSKSAYIRSVLLRELEHGDPGPPDEKAA